MAEIFFHYQTPLLWLGVTFFLIFAAGILATPFLVGMMPADYFKNQTYHQKKMSAARLILAIIRSIFGTVFLLAGLMMLFLPGPGLATIIFGIVLMDFPKKHALMIKVLQSPRIFHALNWLRAKAEKPPFVR